MFLSFLAGNDSLQSVTLPTTFENSALFNVNLISSFCSAVQVEPFWDLNITPAYGCCDIVLSEPITVSPNLPT